MLAAERATDSSSAETEYALALQVSSKFQHIFKHRPEKFTVIFMTTASDYLTGMVRGFYDLVDAMLDHPQAEVIVWGPGFQNWDWDRTIQQNMQGRFFCGMLNIHVNFLGVYNEEKNGSRWYKEWESYKPCPDEIIFEELPDCHDYAPYAPALKCEARRGHTQGTIVSARYAFELTDLFFPMKENHANMMVHTPECANEAKIFPIEWGQKEFSASLIGNLETDLFPLRQTMAKAIEAELIPGASVYKHPGYSFGKFIPEDGLEAARDYVADSPNITNITDNHAAFSYRLQRSKICMFDSTATHKSIAKFYEAFLSGCVVAADLPDEMEELLGDLIIELPRLANQTEVANIINAALADEAGLQLKAARALHTALEHFTCHRKAERILDHVQAFRDGFRGYKFPYGFTSGCKAYHSNQPGKLLQPWCHGARPERSSDAS